jgi:hypothetical protein
MQSLLTQQLHRESENDRLRVAGHVTKIERRRRDRRMRMRASVGNGLISAGERLRGCQEAVVAARLHRT